MDFQSYVRVYWRLLLSVGTISRFTTRIRWEDLQENPFLFGVQNRGFWLRYSEQNPSIDLKAYA